MTAEQLVEMLLDESPKSARTKVVAFHPTAINDGGFYIRGDSDRPAAARLVQNLFNVKVQGDKLKQALDSMINNGYSIVSQNAGGTIIVYSRNQRLRLPIKTQEQMQEYFQVDPLTQRVLTTDEVMLDSNEYTAKDWTDVFPTSRGYSEKPAKKKGEKQEEEPDPYADEPRTVPEKGYKDGPDLSRIQRAAEFFKGSTTPIE